eukprot:CAMPEP_0174825968 /NCGR_PEP_ID=MMETSP1107-20130205/43346_1 /TAXON_ID=36770 /ORGANISM="Paraphysomonas vestita, Strain GFlagA" /LENGTH=78 /DNA_ID=CAMNT_0016058225 /DNA_START=3346 /DNA_END=3585 /DNA_ORIENTATION=+
MCLPQSEQDEELSDKIDHLKGDIVSLESKLQQVQDHILNVSSSIAEIATSVKIITGVSDSAIEPKQSTSSGVPPPPAN